MTPIPDHVLALREKIGQDLLWLPAVTAVVRHPERAEVLLVRRADNGAWTPVTGILDPGEEPAVGAARETLEETGTVVSVDRLAATSAPGEVTHVNGDRASYLDLTFACTWLAGEPRVADDESVDVRWWPLDALPEMSRVMLERIDAAFSDEREARFAAPTERSAAEPDEGEQPAPVLAPEAPVLGVDACARGWVGVLLDPGLRASVFTASTIADLVALVRETAEVAVVAIDGRTSVSAQAYALREKVLQVDTWVRSRPGVRVVEVHPEVSFARMAGAPVLARKKDADGVRARREALARHRIVAPPWFRGAGFEEDDLLDACAAAWTAARHSLGVAESLPATPEVFSDGLPAAIWV